MCPRLGVRPGAGARGWCCAASDDVPATTYHVPVMRDEVVSRLVTEPSGVYLDATLGGGGHSAALLACIGPSGGHLIGTDRDPDALRCAKARLQSYTALSVPQATLLQATFATLPAMVPTTLRALGRGSGDSALLDGILLDLGVSSHQVLSVRTH